LSAAGHDVAVVDRRTPGFGSTIASTAMIQFEIDTPLTKLAKRIGPKAAGRAYLRSYRAVQELGRLIEEHGISADWKDRCALYLSGDDMGHRALETEVRARKRLGLPSEYLDAAALNAQFGIDRTGAILSEGAAELDPIRTTIDCLRTATRYGAKIFTPCEITDVEKAGGRLHLSTREGAALTCRRLIFATGYEVPWGLPRDAFDIVSSWAIATPPLPPAEFWEGRCLIWEASDPYLYLRTTRDDRIIAGGEDSGVKSPAVRASAIPAKSATLIEKVRRLLGRPELEIEYAWAGAFAESPTGLPVIRPHPTLSGAFTILGCGGNGITFSMVAARMAETWLRGGTNADFALFDGA
jgi:glycine/D-amino acid oxidase-like deaminating enzyme